MEGRKIEERGATTKLGFSAIRREEMEGKKGCRVYIGAGLWGPPLKRFCDGKTRSFYALNRKGQRTKVAQN